MIKSISGVEISTVAGAGSCYWGNCSAPTSCASDITEGCYVLCASRPPGCGSYVSCDCNDFPDPTNWIIGLGVGAAAVGVCAVASCIGCIAGGIYLLRRHKASASSSLDYKLMDGSL